MANTRAVSTNDAPSAAEKKIKYKWYRRNVTRSVWEIQVCTTINECCDGAAARACPLVISFFCELGEEKRVAAQLRVAQSGTSIGERRQGSFVRRRRGDKLEATWRNTAEGHPCGVAGAAARDRLGTTGPGWDGWCRGASYRRVAGRVRKLEITYA